MLLKDRKRQRSYSGLGARGEVVSMKTIKVGDLVTYCNEKGVMQPALVTAVHGPSEYDAHPPSVNLAYVSGNPKETDPYGRQIGRDSSVVHQSSQYAEGRYWC